LPYFLRSQSRLFALNTKQQVPLLPVGKPDIQAAVEHQC
jgi:hypothetical protein